MFKFTAEPSPQWPFWRRPPWHASQPFPASFHTQMVETNGTRLNVRVGGQGPGRRAAARLWRYRRHVGAAGGGAGRITPSIVPDLRGMGLSSHPEGGYDKKTQAADIARVLDALKIEKADSRHARHRQHGRLRVRRAVSGPRTRWVIMDAPLPGIGPWDEIIRSPLLWHFNFRGPDVERLVAGRERIYLDRFWNEFSADPEGDRRGDAPALRRALCAARRHAFRLQPVRRVHPGRHDNKALLAKGGS